jgi:hypothetical protein
MEQLTQAKESLERIRQEYKDDPELLACYEPSALHLVRMLENDGYVGPSKSSMGLMLKDE